jgi:TM2 domain-containing membrane protein YozV
MTRFKGSSEMLRNFLSTNWEKQGCTPEENKGIKMKKYILSPLCSAVVVPGFGQILNHKIKKGVTMMVLTFILFIAATVKLIMQIVSEIKQADSDAINNLLEFRLSGHSLTGLWVLIGLLAVLWLYSIIDALIDGIKIEKEAEGKTHEILSDR